MVIEEKRTGDHLRIIAGFICSHHEVPAACLILQLVAVLLEVAGRTTLVAFVLGRRVVGSFGPTVCSLVASLVAILAHYTLAGAHMVVIALAAVGMWPIVLSLGLVRSSGSKNLCRGLSLVGGVGVPTPP